MSGKILKFTLNELMLDIKTYNFLKAIMTIICMGFILFLYVKDADMTYGYLYIVFWGAFCFAPKIHKSIFILPLEQSV